MIEKTSDIYKKLDNLYSSDYTNRIKAGEIRVLFEHYLKFLLGKNENDEFISLQNLFNDYLEIANPEGIIKITPYFIKELNKWHHDTIDELSDDNLKTYFLKFNNIIETISGIENDFFLFHETTIPPSVGDLLTLNKEQRDAINSNSRITYINAGPGTGKTHLIVGRILKLASLNKDDKIVGLAFTNIASNELNNKLLSTVFGNDLSKKIDNVSIYTIHSFALESIKKYFDSSNDENYNYSVIDKDEYDELKEQFSYNKLLIDGYLKDNKLLTFDGILSLFYQKIRTDEYFVYSLKDEISEIIIDEAQDLDKIQYEIFKELYNISENLKLFLVGDQRQNIFEFRGGNFKHFEDVFKNEKYKTFSLTESYRCSQNILDFVNNFKFSDCDNNELKNANNNMGIPLKVFEFGDKFKEAENIVGFISSRKLDNFKLNEVAILYPDSFYFDEIANQLNKNEISFKIFGGDVKLNIHIRFLKNLINAVLNDNVYSLSKVISFWNIFIEIVGKNKNDILINIDNYSPKELELNLIIRFIKSELNSKPILLVKNFIKYCQTHNLFDDEILNEFKLFLNILIENDFNDFNQIITNLTSNHPDFKIFFKRAVDIKCNHLNEDDFLTLSTIHSAKGLEWSMVFMPGLSEDLFPRYGTIDLNSDLKIFYVGCTRAKDELHFTRPIRYRVISKKNGKLYSFEKPKSILLKYLY